MLNSFQTSGNSPGSWPCGVGILVFGIGSDLARRLTGLDSIPLLELTPIFDRRARAARTRRREPIAGPRRTEPVDQPIVNRTTARARAAEAFPPVPVARETINGLSDHQTAEAV